MRSSLKRGMNIVVNNEPRIRNIKVTVNTITAFLIDGRIVSVPLAWSWRLSDATPAQRAKWRLIGDWHGVHWPDVDEDISAEGMLNGTPARRPAHLAGARKSMGPANRRMQPTRGKPKATARG